MHLINNINLVFSYLWRNSNLIDQIPKIINRVVASGIQLKNIESEILCLLFGAILTYFFGKNTCTGCFANTARPREKQGLSKVVIFYGVFQRIGNCLLPNNVLKNGGAVFSGRYDEMFHIFK